MPAGKWTLDSLKRRGKRGVSTVQDSQTLPPTISPNGYLLSECFYAVQDIISRDLALYDRYDNRRIILRGYWPPIYEMDSLQKVEEERLKKCSVLSISQNLIEKISGLNLLRNLRVLSLAQNQIKSLNGLECVAKTLEELIIAWNMVTEVDHLKALTKLKVLDISFNYITTLREYGKLKFCPSIKVLSFKGNPICLGFPKHVWRDMAVRKLPQLTSLDGIDIERESLKNNINSIHTYYVYRKRISQNSIKILIIRIVKNFYRIPREYR